jgi:hypothetical protein
VSSPRTLTSFELRGGAAHRFAAHLAAQARALDVASCARTNGEEPPLRPEEL